MATNEMTLAKAIRDNVATKTDLERLEHRIERELHRLTMRGLGALVTALGLLFAALHLWPPHVTP